IKASPAPYFDVEEEYTMQELVKGLIREKLINAAHDCADGGLFITLLEMGMPRGLGFDIVTDAEIREDAFLFGEAAGRVVVSVTEDNEDEFIERMMLSNVRYTLLGHVTKGKMVIDDDHYGFIDSAKKAYTRVIEEIIEK